MFALFFFWKDQEKICKICVPPLHRLTQTLYSQYVRHTVISVTNNSYEL